MLQWSYATELLQGDSSRCNCVGISRTVTSQQHKYIIEELCRMSLTHDVGTSNPTPRQILRIHKHYPEHVLLIYKQFTSKCVLGIITQYTVSLSRKLSLVTGSLLSVWIISRECVAGWPKVLPAPLLALLWALYSACLICSTGRCFLVPSSAQVKVDTGRYLEPESFAHTCQEKKQSKGIRKSWEIMRRSGKSTAKNRKGLNRTKKKVN
jgi:hypothetical protein